MSEAFPAGSPYRAAIGEHESLSIEHLRTARRLLSTYCSSTPSMCRHYLRVVSEVSRLVAKVRLEDLGLDEKYSGADADMLRLYKRMVEFYSAYLSGVLVMVGERILCRVVRGFKYNRSMLMEGEVILLRPSEAAALYMAGLIEPVKSVALRYQVEGGG